MIVESLDLLGYPVRDKVRGIKGIVASVSFDLYGCVQAYVQTDTTDPDDKLSRWLDVKRLEIQGPRVMSAPNFGQMEFGEETGGNDLPSPDRSLPRP